jgi:hypothetical protein
MRSFTGLCSTVSPLCLVAALASALGVVAVGGVFESEESKAKRLQLKRQKEVRAFTGRISAYARSIHQRYPRGDVVLSESDLAAITQAN